MRVSRTFCLSTAGTGAGIGPAWGPKVGLTAQADIAGKTRGPIPRRWPILNKMRAPASKPSAGALGELNLVEQIRHRADGASAAGLRLGIGDDCALLRLRMGEELAVTTDLSIADRHFDLGLHPPESIGHRALARGLSDLAAMGARPVAAFLSLGLPRSLAGDWLSRFLDGFFALALMHKVPLAGGDLAESPLAVADIVLTGAVPRGKALLRSGASPGDLVYVTGTLGGSAAGLEKLTSLARSNRGTSRRSRPGFLLRSDRGSGSSNPRIPAALEEILAPHLYPEPRVTQGLFLVRRGLASAAIDLSDGLSTDLAHLCSESGVAAEIDSALLPIHAGATLAQALHGGEDYELLFTAPVSVRMPRRIAGAPVTQIGRVVRAGAGRPPVTLVTARGSEPLAPKGWQHFS
jgi:thiamine-monophosphate kinase